MRVGDVVVPTFESQQRGHVLACGCGRYTHAIVGSVTPFVLVSEAGDMVWSCTWFPDDVTCLCQAHPEIVQRVLERLERTGEHKRKAAEAQCDAMDADLRPFLSELVYKLRRKWMKAVDAIQRKKGGA